MIIYLQLTEMKVKGYSNLRGPAAWTILILGLMLISWGCFWRKQPFLYPRGPIFPLKIKAEIGFPGTPQKKLIKQGDYLFWTTQEGELFAYQLSQQKMSWHFSFPPSPVSLLAHEEDKLYWGDGQGQIRCFNLTGEKIWQRDMGGELRQPVVVSSGHLYALVGRHQVIALNGDEGQILWSYSFPEDIQAGPATAAPYVVVGDEKGTLYILNQAGKLYFTFPLKKKISSSFFLLQDRCYFSTADNHYCALDLRRQKILWQVNLGGEVFGEPINWEKKIIVPLWSGVVFCLQSKSGEIKWWRPLPGRTDFSPALAEDQVLISSQSSSVVSYLLPSGQLKGTMDLGYTLKSNLVWVEPDLYLLAEDEQKDESFLVELEKEVKVTLRAEPPSPQTLGEEIKIIAEAVGFYQPEYEFYRAWQKEREKEKKKGEEKKEERKEEKKPTIVTEEIVQPFSSVNSWTWYPEQTGKYVIRVVVKDKQEKAEAQLEYVIKEKKAEEKKEKISKGRS